MSWFEPLPDKCPPEEAIASSGATFYRVLKSGQVDDREFLSHRALNPDKQFMVNECQAMAISVFTNIEDCHKVIKMPTYRNQPTHIGEVVLEEKDGVIANTPSRFSDQHFSWWRSKAFNIHKVKIIFLNE